MATIVMHRPTETNYVLVGMGYGLWATEKPGVFGFTDHKEGGSARAFVCDVDGLILGVDPDDLLVVSVDGSPVATLLGQPPANSV